MNFNLVLLIKYVLTRRSVSAPYSYTVYSYSHEELQPRSSDKARSDFFAVLQLRSSIMSILHYSGISASFFLYGIVLFFEKISFVLLITRVLNYSRTLVLLIKSVPIRCATSCSTSSAHFSYKVCS